MRLTPIVIAVAVAGAAFAVSAQPAPDDARIDFQTELGRQCPEKQLQLLSARALRDGLDDYLSSLADAAKVRLQQTERDRCSSMDAGAACVNDADIAGADQVGRMSELAGSICGYFNRCTDEGVCDYAR